MSDNLLDQADALMRRRVFVAGANSGPVAPDDPEHAMESSETDADSTLENVPILTDVVVAHDIQSDAKLTDDLKPETFSTSRAESNSSRHFDRLLSERQAVLTREIETWLDEQLPQMVIRAMDGITDHLVALLANRARDDLLPRLEAAMQAPQEAAADADSAES